MKTITIPIIKVTLLGLLSLLSLNLSAADYFLNYSSFDDKIEKLNLPTPNTVDSTELTQHNKSVDLFSTNLMQENNYVKISWETIMEMNNSYFTIERSLDAQNWEKINEVTGAGTSSQIQSYSSIDKTPYHGISYYRIKSTDFNGNYEYSRVEAIEVALKSFEVQIFPQPAEDYFTLTLSGFTDEILELTILASDGLIVKETINVYSGNRFNVSDLNSGIYFIQVKNNNLSEVFRMIKK